MISTLNSAAQSWVLHYTLDITQYTHLHTCTLAQPWSRFCIFLISKPATCHTGQTKGLHMASSQNKNPGKFRIFSQHGCGWVQLRSQTLRDLIPELPWFWFWSSHTIGLKNIWRHVRTFSNLSYIAPSSWFSGLLCIVLVGGYGALGKVWNAI